MGEKNVKLKNVNIYESVFKNLNKNLKFLQFPKLLI